MIASSSLPSVPLSPACGFKPSTSSRGRSMRKRRCEIRVRDANRALELRAVERGRDRAQRQVRRRERHAQRFAGEQHHRLRRARELREKLGMARRTRTPDWLMTLFCTGAVTSACACLRVQSCGARRSMSSTYGALRGSSVPATTGAAQRDRQHVKAADGVRPDVGHASRHARSSTRVAERARARLEQARVAEHARGAPRIGRVASASEMSGPMPAGSPELTTMTAGGAHVGSRYARACSAAAPQRFDRRGRAATGGCRRTPGRAAAAAHSSRSSSALRRANLPRALLALHFVGGVVRAALQEPPRGASRSAS